VQDLFAPEINSDAPTGGSPNDWTTDNDRSDAAESFAKGFLQSYSGTGNDINKQRKAFTSSGLDPGKIYVGEDAASFIGVPVSDPRVPEVIGIAQYGTVYTGGTKKIAEHGGDNPQDRDVPIVVSGNPIGRAGAASDTPVETTQIAPTILDLLGLDPNALQAVQLEHIAELPIGH
jgi:hypothetical protein